MFRTLPRCTGHIARDQQGRGVLSNCTLRKCYSRKKKNDPRSQDGPQSTYQIRKQRENDLERGRKRSFFKLEKHRTGFLKAIHDIIEDKPSTEIQKRQDGSIKGVQQQSTKYLQDAYGITDNRYLHKISNSKFEDYLNRGKVAKGLREGTLKEGRLRIAKGTQRTVFVSLTDGSPDIFIPDGFVNKNRAFHGDIVAVEILPQEDEENPFTTKDSGKGFAQLFVKVSAAGDMGSEEMACQLLKQFQCSAKGEILRHCPIKIEKCPLDKSSDVFQNPSRYINTLYFAQILGWEASESYASGKLLKSIGERGKIQAETQGILLEHGVKEGFSKHVMECLPKESPWQIPQSEYEYRRDFRKSCLFTIDPATARDIDDALCCEDLGNGQYKVSVHIADVSYFVKENTALDKEALERSTSYYLVQKAIHMLPELLSSDLCSLNPDVERLAFSVEWIITENGEILEEWYGRSVIKSCAKLSYDHAQSFIDNHKKEWSLDEFPPITKPYSPNDLAVRVQNLNKLAVCLRKKRFDSGSLKLDKIKLQYRLDDETGYPNGCYIYEHRESNRMIEEFMLLANMTVAKILKNAFPQQAVLRNHEDANVNQLESMKQFFQKHGIELDVSSAGTLQRSMENYERQDNFNPSIMQAIIIQCMKSIKIAKYICTGSLENESQYAHYALNVPLYTHFTSPIRRYPDILVHRLLGATLGYCKHPTYKPGDIQRTLDHCNLRKEASKKVDDLSIEMFFCAFLNAVGPIIEKATVISIKKNYMEVLIPQYGLTRKIKLRDNLDYEKLLTEEDVSVSLKWKIRSVPQLIPIFSEIECKLITYSSTSWDPVLLPPEDDLSIDTSDNIDNRRFY